jgi:diguanylate cyclase (GGDEF)-like protein
VDESSGLPDRAAFEANLDRLVRASKEAETDCGLLLVKLDKFDQLTERHRRAGAEEFLKRLAGVVCRTVRDEELVSRYNRDTLAVLMPAIDSQAGGQLAGTIRDRVRSYQFRLDATGPEVLVTASFGYTRLFPGDTAELALNRAGCALERSCGRGRNQLHVHDGSDVTHCLAAG